MQRTDVLDISSHVCGKGATLVVRGELDSATAPRFADEVRSLVSHPGRHVTVDLGETTFVGVSGLRALIAALCAARAQGGDIVLQAPPRSLQKVLQLCGADSVFAVE